MSGQKRVSGSGKGRLGRLFRKHQGNLTVLEELMMKWGYSLGRREGPDGAFWKLGRGFKWWLPELANHRMVRVGCAPAGGAHVPGTCSRCPLSEDRAQQCLPHQPHHCPPHRGPIRNSSKESLGTPTLHICWGFPLAYFVCCLFVTQSLL